MPAPDSDQKASRNDPWSASFWTGRRVLITGHTGFIGGWLSLALLELGADVHGIALPPPGTPSLFAASGLESRLAHRIVDLRDLDPTRQAVREAMPEIVFHLAAQPIVRQARQQPVESFATNVMGTVHLLDALRRHGGLRAALVVTSDKVYENDDTGRAHAEDDRLGGHDPYSASKAATEIVVASFRRSWFAPAGVPLVTARGGNVVGGGDFGADRLVPDILRAAMAGRAPVLRNPEATRPWQHVLDCLSGYFTYLEAAAGRRDLPAALNFGPSAGMAPVPVAEVARRIQSALGIALPWVPDAARGPHEMTRLAIDARRATEVLGWRPRLGTEAAIAWTAEWYGAWLGGGDMAALCARQIAAYEEIPA